MEKTRNPELAKSIGRFGRSQTYKRRGLWAIKAKNGGKFPVHPKKEKPAEAVTKAPRFYPAEDVPKPIKKNVLRNPTKLRASITPGTVLILLAGRFKGKRVVFLKQLPSGLLLVTGPPTLNKVPLRRVNQKYVIATSTKIEITGLDVSKIEDKQFVKEKTKGKKGEGEFFEDGEEKKGLPAELKDAQTAVESHLMPLIEAVPQLKEYLGARFSLKSGMKPHELKF